MMLAGLFALVFVGIVLVTAPAVPWDILGYAVPVGVLLAAIPVIPFSRVVWLTADVLVRPIVPSELRPPSK